MTTDFFSQQILYPGEEGIGSKGTSGRQIRSTPSQSSPLASRRSCRHPAFRPMISIMVTEGNVVDQTDPMVISLGSSGNGICAEPGVWSVQDRSLSMVLAHHEADVAADQVAVIRELLKWCPWNHFRRCKRKLRSRASEGGRRSARKFCNLP